MNDFPSGRWSSVLIGHQWPDAASLEALAVALESRAGIAAEQLRYAEQLRLIHANTLSMEEGNTASTVIAAFKGGEVAATRSSDHNDIKRRSYTLAIRTAEELRGTLSEIARNGNFEIDRILSSRKTLPDKVSSVVATIVTSQTQANAKAASCSADLLDSIQAILDAGAFDTSARQFVSNNGLELASAFQSPGAEHIAHWVERDLTRSSQLSTSNGSPPSSDSLFSGGELMPPTGQPVQRPSPLGSELRTSDMSTAFQSQDAAGGENLPGQSRIPPKTNDPLGLRAGQAAVCHEIDPNLPIPNTSIARPATSNNPSIPSQLPISSISTPGHDTITPTNSGLLLTSAAVPASSTETTSASPALSATDLVESFNAGNHTGAPLSAAAEAVATAASGPVHPAPAAALIETASPATHFETAHATAAPAVTAPAAAIPAEAPQAVITPAQMTPVFTQPPISAAPVALPSAPATGLLAYGSDLRTSAIAAPSIPPTPPAAAPGSAPLSTASSPGQSGVVRQQPSTGATSPSGTGAGLTERAVAATSVGAATAACANQSAAEDRLRRLLDSVARQRPELRWAIADLEDGSTLLTTDLAGGWIPPRIGVPAGVRLLPPAKRQRGLIAMLGSTTLSATYRPGQYLPPAKNAESVAMSIRARDTTAVNDLGWELVQATRWRDGLPRLAHTLAKAASTQTGCLDSEIQLLRDSIGETSCAVLSAYPDNIDSMTIGNWQLMATIDSLIHAESTLANYHFSWFRALQRRTDGLQ